MTKLNPNDDSVDARLAQAIQLHIEGVAGNVNSVKEANRLLEKLRIDYPNNPLLDAYYGSSMVLIARDKTKPLEQLKWANNGLRILDKAVADAPHDSIIRLLRGKSAYKLPEKYFRRTQTAIEDYTTLLDQKIHQEGKLELGEYSQLINELGEAYYRIGRNQDAADFWRRMENQTEDADLKILYRSNLQSLEGKPAIVEIKYEGPTSMLIGATRAVGTALIEWSDQEKDKKKKSSNSKQKSSNSKQMSNNSKQKKDRK